MAEGDHGEQGTASEGLYIFEIIFGIIIVLYFLYKLRMFIGAHSGPNTSFSLGGFFASIFPSVQFISIFISALLIMGIIYASFKLSHLNRMKKVKERHEKEKQFIVEEEGVNPKWQRVRDHVMSENPSDWRLAILEADILLGDILTKMGYQGEGIGEQLKTVEKSDFHTIDNAWEAHKIRNAIAHEGADFILSQREAQRAIGLYQSVFEEFHFI